MERGLIGSSEVHERWLEKLVGWILSTRQSQATHEMDALHRTDHRAVQIVGCFMGGGDCRGGLLSWDGMEMVVGYYVTQLWDIPPILQLLDNTLLRSELGSKL